MNQIMEQIAAEKIAAQSAEIEGLRRLLVALVWKTGAGKPVLVSAGTVRQASKTVESIEFRQLRSGEIRFTVKQVEQEGTQ